MVFKTNYGQARAERNRAKQAKKEAKEQEKRDAVARRQAAGLPEEEGVDEAPGEEDEDS